MTPPSRRRRARRLLSAALLILCPAIAGATGAPDRPDPGRLIESLSADRISENLKTLASTPRLAGTPGDRRMADWVASRLKESGLEVEISEYQVWLPWPVSVAVELLGPEPYRCRLQEEGDLADPDTTMPGLVMTYNAYSPSGTVEGDLVYVNYGLPEDYDTLEKLGVSVKGRLVIARYGRGYRGDKVEIAAAKGAIGCLLYSDPADDGYMRGDVLPRGPWRNEWGVQRGSVLRGAGDPLTPGWAATAGAQRLEPEKAANLPRIPVTPLAYGDARPLLEQLGGPLAPHESAAAGGAGPAKSWQGGLPFAYHVGPGPARVRLSVQADYALRPIWDVVGRLPGGADPDHAVILGAHRDSWGPGAMDNGSGSATLLEVARAFAAMARAGAPPSRTLLFAFWDAEEFGIIGSTEWAEDHAAWLDRAAVAYLNVDVAATGGRFNPSGSPTLRTILTDAAAGVTDPVAHRTVKEVWLASSKSPSVGSLGGGSDFVPFSHDLAVPSTSHSFSGDGGGAYHSVADTWWFVSTFMDPGFLYHRAAAGVWALTALSLSEQPVLAYDQEAAAKEAIAAADEIEARAREAGAADTPMPSLDPVRGAARRYAGVAERVAARRRRVDLPAAGEPSAFRRFAAANDELIAAEREFLVREPTAAGGTHGRNLLISASTTDGYGSQGLPAVAAAFRSRDAAAARREIDLLAAAFDRAADHLERAARTLRSGQR